MKLTADQAVAIARVVIEEESRTAGGVVSAVTVERDGVYPLAVTADVVSVSRNGRFTRRRHRIREDGAASPLAVPGG